jgi:hypothetical protein
VPLNKWLQVDGKDPVESMTALTPMYDPRYLMLGDYITGNFTKTQRNQLIEYVTQHKVYEYDPAKVTKKSEAGKDFYVYHAKVDSDKLYEYNRLAASFMGLDASLVKDMLDVQGTREVTLLIDIKEEYLAKVVTDNVTTIYSGWNATKLPDEPKPAAAYNEFQQQSLESGAPRSTSSDSLSERAKDVFRQNNVMTLVTLVEKYYAENSFFPTLAELNDPAWVRSNLPELDSSTLKDPDGTTEMLAAKPTKGAYSYQVSADDSLSSCDNQEIFCYNYRITAFLSNGTAYVQTSEG